MSVLVGIPDSPVGQRMVSYLPPVVGRSVLIQRVLAAVGLELGRIEERANAIREQFFPRNADDTWRLLQVWEREMGLPSDPVGLTVEERQEAVLAATRQRRTPSGAHWISLITSALGAAEWTYEEQDVYIVVIAVPIAFDSALFANVNRVARRVTPAHLQLFIMFEGGFLIEISLIEVDPL